MRSAISASDHSNFIRNTLQSGVKTSRGGTNTKNLVKHTYSNTKGNTRTNFLISIPDDKLYNNSMPKGNVRNANPEKVMLVANYRQRGGQYKLPTINEANPTLVKFIYTPMLYTRNETYRYPPPLGRGPANTKRMLLQGYSVRKPPPRKPPEKFTMNPNNKKGYNSRRSKNHNNFEPYYYPVLNYPVLPNRKKKKSRK